MATSFLKCTALWACNRRFEVPAVAGYGLVALASHRPGPTWETHTKVCCYSLRMNRKRIKEIALRSAIGIVLAMLFASLLAQLLFHPK